MNKFKQISLLFASLFLLVSAVIAQPNNPNKSSFQTKNPDQSASAVLTDVDDALDAEQLFNAYCLHFIPLTPPSVSQPHQPLRSLAHLPFSPLPFYLRIRSLRI